MRCIYMAIASSLFASPCWGSSATPNDDVARWQPAAPFAINATPKGCMAVAGFRRGGDVLRLALEIWPTTDQFQVLIEVAGADDGKRWDNAKVMLGGKPISKSITIEHSNRPGTLIYAFRSNREDLTSLGNSTELNIQSSAFRANLDLDNLPAAMSNLDACAADLLEDWGFSDAQQKGLYSYPRPEKRLGEYASSDDYPVAAYRASAYGEVHALLAVSEKGRASNCRIIRSSGRRDLDDKTCEIVTQRARYVPARTIDGAKTEAPAYVTFRWELPQD